MSHLIGSSSHWTICKMIDRWPRAYALYVAYAKPYNLVSFNSKKNSKLKRTNSVSRRRFQFEIHTNKSTWAKTAMHKSPFQLFDLFIWMAVNLFRCTPHSSFIVHKYIWIILFSNKFFIDKIHNCQAQHCLLEIRFNAFQRWDHYVFLLLLYFEADVPSVHFSLFTFCPYQ